LLVWADFDQNTFET